MAIHNISGLMDIHLEERDEIALKKITNILLILAMPNFRLFAPDVLRHWPGDAGGGMEILLKAFFGTTEEQREHRIKYVQHCMDAITRDQGPHHIVSRTKQDEEECLELFDRYMSHALEDYNNLEEYAADEE